MRYITEFRLVTAGVGACGDGRGQFRSLRSLGMERIPLAIDDVIHLRPRIFGDARGFFLELYHAERFAQQGIATPFVQDNLSRSQQGVLRGLHYQLTRPQGKLVTCLSGAICDVAVDLRRSSATFGQHVMVELNDVTRDALYIPPGFAHGFYVLSETADVLYKCTDLYAPTDERTVLWNDAQLAIAWPLIGPPTLSDKDQRGRLFADAECYS